ncbi:hypothetical protein MHZ93_16535 [Roseomonas sp. ACRSG]|nr:hypothetical protein [Roseomonas sp. ACRSG]
MIGKNPRLPSATNPSIPQDSIGLRALLTEIAEKREAAAARIQAIRREQGPIALLAHQGEAEAKAILAALTQESAECIVKVDQANDMQAEGRRLLEIAMAAEAAEAEVQRRAEAGRVAKELEPMSGEVDRALALAVEKAAAREAKIGELRRYDPARAERMQRRSEWLLRMAFEASGLAALLGYRAGTNAGRAPLAQNDAAMLADLLGKPVGAQAAPEPEPEPVPPVYTVRHKGGGRWVVMNGETAVTGALTKLEAEAIVAFGKLPDAEPEAA